MKFSQEHFNLLRKIFKNPNLTQRKLSNELKISLGKINYILSELKKKGLIKITNFNENKDKLRYIYILTPKGISHKTKLTINFMKLKMREYDELKKEIKLNKKKTKLEL